MARDWSELFIADDPAGTPDDGEASAGRREGRRGLFRRLRENLTRTREALGGEIKATLFGPLDAQAWERLEEALIVADVGARTTAAIVATLESEADAGELEGGEALSERLVGLLAQTADVGDGRIDIRAKPTVILAVGVNGTGKTTTIGKLAWHLHKRAAADRAARRRGHVPGGRQRAARGLGAARGL